MTMVNEIRVQFRGNAIRTGFLWGVQLVNITDICVGLGIDVTPTRFNAMHLDQTRSYWAPMQDMVSGLEALLVEMLPMKDAFPDMINNIVVFKDMLPATMNFPTPEFLEYARQGGSENYALYPAQIRRCILEALQVPVSGNSYVAEVPQQYSTQYAILWHVADASLRRSMAANKSYKECYQTMKQDVYAVAALV